MAAKVPSAEEATGGPASVLAKELGDKNWRVRRDARLALQEMGEKATPFIIPVLHDGNENARWEAAKTLISIADIGAAPALVDACDDKSYEIQWLAAEALIALGTDAIIPVLDALIRNPESPALRGGAHHVLHDLERKQHLPEPVLDVLDNIRSIGLNENLVMLARKAVKYMNEQYAKSESESD